MTPATAQAEVTLSAAQNAYNRVSNLIRDRHDDKARPQSWETATAHVVMALMDWEAVAVMRYLATTDVLLAKTLAARLNLTITFARRELE